MWSVNSQLKWRLGGTLAFIGLSFAQCFAMPTTNSIPRDLFLTDNGFLFWQRPSGQMVVNVKDIQEAQKNPESRPAGEYPQGNWGDSTNGFQLSLRFQNQVFTNGEPVLATTLMRNVTNIALTYYFPVQIIAMKDGKTLKPKGGLGFMHITMLPEKTVFPQTQIKYQEKLNNEYDLSKTGAYFFQAVCHHPEVSSKSVAVLITNSIAN
jgi:hypothetical protein